MKSNLGETISKKRSPITSAYVLSTNANSRPALVSSEKIKTLTFFPELLKDFLDNLFRLFPPCYGHGFFFGNSYRCWGYLDHVSTF